MFPIALEKVPVSFSMRVVLEGMKLFALGSLYVAGGASSRVLN